MNRTLLLGVVVLVALAGCSSGGPSRAVESGTAASVDSDTLEVTGYEPAGTENRTLNTTVSATVSGDVELNGERAVTATIPVASYRTETAEGPALFLVAASPAVRPIENQPVARDPLATLGAAERANFVQSAYTVSSTSRGANVTATLLGNETDARTYAASSGQGDVTVSIASVRDGEEFVTVIAITPTGADETRFQRLVGGVTH